MGSGSGFEDAHADALAAAAARRPALPAVVAALQHAAAALPWPGRVAAASALGKARGTCSKQSLLLDHFVNTRHEVQ